MNFLLAAMDLCAFGWKVFPLVAGQKIPAIPKQIGGRGVLDATDSLDRLAEWNDRYPGANVAVACGIESGIIVVDIDPRNGGMAALSELRNAGCVFPQTVCSRTAGGGFHGYFKFTPGPNNSKSRLGKGIDIKTTGGYVVAPPSRIFGSGAYEWIRKPIGDSLPSLPRWALERLKPREETPFYTETRGDGDIEALISFLEAAPGGERNSILHWCSMRAGEAVRRGEISQQEALGDMVNAAMRCGLDRSEAMKTAKSGISRGMRGR
jgi:Bifunctional DNA primase/polymerase, N-terminal